MYYNVIGFKPFKKWGLIKSKVAYKDLEYISCEREKPKG